MFKRQYFNARVSNVPVGMITPHIRLNFQRDYVFSTPDRLASHNSDSDSKQKELDIGVHVPNNTMKHGFDQQKQSDTREKIQCSRNG